MIKRDCLWAPTQVAHDFSFFFKGQNNNFSPPSLFISSVLKHKVALETINQYFIVPNKLLKNHYIKVKKSILTKSRNAPKAKQKTRGPVRSVS